MAGSGICVVMPFRLGFRENWRTPNVKAMWLTLKRLLEGRGASGFDVCDLDDVPFRRSLTATSREVSERIYPNAPYHSYIYPYFDYFGGLDDSTHMTMRPVSLPQQWVNDLNSPDDVHHYVFGYMTPDDLHHFWPDGSDGPGLFAGNGSTAYYPTVEAPVTCTIGNQTASAFSGTMRVTVPAIPASVVPILINADGGIGAWTYRQKWHYWCGLHTNDNFWYTAPWYTFLLGTLAHITKVRHKDITTNRIRVWIDVDDLCRNGITNWYQRGEGDPNGIVRFANAAYVKGFGRPNLCVESTLPSLQGSPNLVNTIRTLAIQGLAQVNPHCHESPYKDIIDFLAIDTEAKGVAYLRQAWKALESFGIPVYRKYLSGPGNAVTEPFMRAAASMGVQLMRGGDWVAKYQGSVQPMHVGCTSRVPRLQSYTGLPMWRTGKYTGLYVDGAAVPYTWATLAAKSQWPVDKCRSNMLSFEFMEILFGSDRIETHGFTDRTHCQPSAHLVFHPNALYDDNCGIDILDWLSQWNKIYPYYEGEDDAVRFATCGS